jgi:peroxiredoxin
MKPKFQLNFNDLAPDFEVLTTAGEPVRLSTLWSRQPLLLAFIRHFGCPQCKLMLSELQQSLHELEHHGIALAIITQGNPEETREFCLQYAPGMICLSDPDHKVYTAYGLGRGNLVQTFLSPEIWKGNSRAREQGFVPQMPPAGQDALLMSGLFIIGPDGRVRFPYYYDNIADHPALSQLMDGFLGTPWELPFDGPIKPEHE